jgi:hypothetical protein
MGWTFWGFFFGAYWGLYHRLWFIGITHIVVSFLIFPTIQSDEVFIIFSVVGGILWGAFGNYLRASKLSSNGYIAQSEVYANSAGEALGLFYNSNVGK